MSKISRRQEFAAQAGQVSIEAAIVKRTLTSLGSA